MQMASNAWAASAAVDVSQPQRTEKGEWLEGERQELPLER